MSQDMHNQAVTDVGDFRFGGVKITPFAVGEVILSL